MPDKRVQAVCLAGSAPRPNFEGQKGGSAGISQRAGEGAAPSVRLGNGGRARRSESGPRRALYPHGIVRGVHTWTVDEVHRFEKRHPIGTKARLALGLLLYTGVRRSDAVRLGPQMERAGWLCFTETKGQARKRKERKIPIIPELRILIDATPSGHLAYITTQFGKPFTAAGFGNWFRRRCDEVGLTHCSAHGLRKAGATNAAENGATEHELMAIFGWDSPKQAALYTRAADHKRLAGAAMHKLVPNVPPDEPEVSHRKARS